MPAMNQIYIFIEKVCLLQRSSYRLYMFGIQTFGISLEVGSQPY